MAIVFNTRVLLHAERASDREYFGSIIQDAGFELVLDNATAPGSSLSGSVLVLRDRANDGECAAGKDCRIRRAVAELPSAERVLLFTDTCREPCVVAGLEAGAHQVFALDESARLTRARLLAAFRGCIERRPQVLEVGPFQFSLDRREVRMDGLLVPLSPKEYDLALHLFQNIDRVIGNAELMSAVWSLPAHLDARRIDTAACRVRKKMGLGVITRYRLVRIRGKGYRLEMDEAAAINEAEFQPRLMERGRRIPRRQHARRSDTMSDAETKS